MFNQLTGQSFMGQYGAIFIKSLNTMRPFTFKVISSAVTLLGPIITFSLVDVIGRRRIYLTAGTACTAVLLMCGGVGTGNVTPGDKTGIVTVCIQLGCFYIMSFGHEFPYAVDLHHLEI